MLPAADTAQDVGAVSCRRVTRKRECFFSTVEEAYGVSQALRFTAGHVGGVSQYDWRTESVAGPSSDFV